MSGTSGTNPWEAVPVGCGQGVCSELWENVGKFAVDMVERSTLRKNKLLNGREFISAHTCINARHIVGVEMSVTWHLIGFL